MRGIKNHEGYHDPTACVAIRRCEFGRRREKSRIEKRHRLMYKVEESPGFPRIIDGTP